MAENYKHLYQQMKKMVDMYQDEIVPGLWKEIKALEASREELRENFVDYVCSGISNPAPYCKNRCDECVDSWGWCRQTDKCRGFNPDGERREGE